MFVNPAHKQRFISFSGEDTSGMKCRNWNTRKFSLIIILKLFNLKTAVERGKIGKVLQSQADVPTWLLTCWDTAEQLKMPAVIGFNAEM